ncbi:MAG: 30S ribosomal protein S16 [Kineosporiaceae bacterium]
MSVKIRLKRMGKIRAPYYRIVVADARTKRDGRAIEEIGKYHPTVDPSYIEVDSERAQYWLAVGAQPTEQVLAILKVTGDWQKFKGEPGAEGTLRAPQQKADKRAVFEAAAREGLGEAGAEGATTPRGRKRAQPSQAAGGQTAERPSAPATVPATEAATAAAAAPVTESATEAVTESATAAAAAPATESATASAVESATASTAPASEQSAQPDGQAGGPATDQPADAADEGAPGGSETSAQVDGADETAQAEG